MTNSRIALSPELYQVVPNK